MSLDIPMIFIAGFLIFFMGGFFFTYYAILWFESEAKKEDEEMGKILNLPSKGKTAAFSKEAAEELAERKKVA